MKRADILTAAGLLATVGLAAMAGPGRAAGLNEIDKDCLKATAQSNLEEVQFEPVVRTHAATREGRRFGERMKLDHARAQADLRRLAARVGYELPKDVSEDQRHIMARLGQFRGARFDAAYRQEMIHDHTEDIAQTEREISLGSDPRVIAGARKNLALLRMHLTMSQALPGAATSPDATGGGERVRPPARPGASPNR